MLFKRQYNPSASSFFGVGAFGAVRMLLVINITAFIILNLFPRFPWFFVFGLVPAEVVAHFKLWQLATYLFVHGGLWHLVINMLMLWMFGTVLEAEWGMRRFLAYYFLTGIGAGICSTVFAWGSSVPVMGASGAIFGLLVAFGVLFPESTILLFLFVPMKMKYAVAVLAGINLLATLSSPGNEVAYLAQLGGGVAGYLYLRQEWLRFKLAGLRVSAPKYIPARQKPAAQQSKEELDREVDAVLDKISLHGMNSLTKNERETLTRKSKMP